MFKRLLSLGRVFKIAAKNFIAGESITYASSLAFYTIFSMPAVLIITTVVATTLYEQSTVQHEMIDQIARLIGRKSASEIETILSNATLTSQKPLAKAVGIGTLVFSATVVFVSLQNSLNAIWKIKAKPERGFVKFLINRLISMAMIISMGFILLVSLVIDTTLVVFQNKLSAVFPHFTVHLLTAINLLVSLGMVTVIFALLFKVLPDAHIKWRDVWVGALITMLLFSTGKYLIGFYLGNSTFSSAYGAAGSLVVILLWVYYSSAIVLYGAEFTYVYTQEIGDKIRPYKNAVKIEVVELEKIN